MTRKLFISLFVLIIIFSIYPIASNATDYLKDGDNFLSSGGNTVIEDEALQDISSTLYTVFLTIGVVVAVAVAGILGIKFMTGSIEAQAKVKESLIPFVVGCVIVFGAFGIWRMVVTIGNNIF